MSATVIKEYICVVCPNGCLLEATVTKDNPPALLESEGGICPKGNAWLRQEVEAPLRTFSTSVLVEGGEFIQASVRVTSAISLEKIFEAVAEIKRLHLTAPLKIGDVLLREVAGVKTEVIVTRNIPVKQTGEK